MQAKLRFHGAAQEVTGSMHLIENNGHTIALDCGMFHGRRATANAKNRSFPCPPSRIDAVALSHAHIDHCGKLPRLVKEGFSGPIYATPATCDLVKLLLADSAYIQEEDAAYWNRKRVKLGEAPIEPLYKQPDVDEVIKLLEPRRLGEGFEAADDIHVTLHEAGHMLGSAGMSIEVGGRQNDAVRVVFTGDLGRLHLAILRDPAPLPECDYLICESTYGGRETQDNQRMDEQLAEVINRTIEQGGKLIIPAFAVGRTQVIVYHFRRLAYERRIPQNIPLIVDSPLAVRATDVFRQHPEVYDVEASAFRRVTGDLFKCPDCEYTRSVEQSKALHARKEPMIIISASGMCEAGRILHHLKNNIGNPRNTILIVGYQAAHTLGRRLVEKQKQIRIFGETYKVKARVKTLNGFSAHADASELVEWTAPLASCVRRVFLVHGEPDQAQALAAGMGNSGFKDVVIPESGQTFEI
ncbi:MAG: MBL fold metallo-hydrolase [Phycisphaerae bacterium]|nr:MBL fold metallo-hydrolase [Phycisphaerae bacterium]